MNRLLETLASESFSVEMGFLLPPLAMRRRLQRSPDVRRVEQAVREGAITEVDVREFSEDLTRAYRPGFLLPGQMGLAALAVAVQFCPQDFAEEYLCHLARLKVTELGTAIGVARECLTARFARPKYEVRQFPFPDRPRQVVPQPRILSPRSGGGRWRAGGHSLYQPAGA